MYKKGMFRGKKITVIGLGLLGRGLGDITFLAKEGADLIVTDLKTEAELKVSIKALQKFGNISYTLGTHDLKDFENRDFILKAAGVPLDSIYITHAKKHGVPVYMSTALFASLIPAPIIGVTGTRGKTTVTYMLYEIMKAEALGAQKIWLGGNIQGVSTLPLVSKVKKGDVVVLELDSWQLQGFGDLKLSPHVAVFTTFMPDHLNYYKQDLDVYFEDKTKIFLHQTEEDIFVAGDQMKKQKRPFPKHTIWAGKKDLPSTIKLSIKGEHNRYNAGLAYVTAEQMGVKKSVIQKTLKEFRGVPGRLENIKTWKGIDIYNDTTATTPEALEAALKALGTKRNVILIMGGSDKTLNLSILSKSIQEYCKLVVLLSGTGTDRLVKENIIPSRVPTNMYSDFSDAVEYALSQSTKGDTILLSPGFASFGMFANEYDRGDQFIGLVKKLAV